MATKVTKDETKKAAPSKGAADTSLDVLHPERDLPIAGRVVTVREYGHIEGLRLQSTCRAFFEALYSATNNGGTAPTVAAVSDVLADHADLVRDMIAVAITPVSEDAAAFNREVRENSSWVGALGDIDGELLLGMWWGVNSGFFIRRLLGRAVQEKAAARRRAGDTST